MSMCFNQKPPKDRYNFRTATLLSAYLWLRLTPAKVIVSIAYEVEETDKTNLMRFINKIKTIGAIPKIVAVNASSSCDCVSQALWLRNLAYHHADIKEDGLMMISESDVLITSGDILKPLDGNFRAWVYWSEPAMFGGKDMQIYFQNIQRLVIISI